MSFRPILGVLLCVALWLAGAPGGHAQTIISLHKDYRFINMRRHNDIQGVEAIYDDYRRGWLRRYNSEVLVGQREDKDIADTPRCSRVDGELYSQMKRANCGGGHVFRSNLTAIYGHDSDRGSTSETGALGFVSYERIFPNDNFVGFGVTFGKSSISHTLNGMTLDVDTTDVGGHLLAGYRFANGSWTTWNISFIKAIDDTTRNGNITGSYDSTSLMVTGVWYNDYELAHDLYLTYGIDYTFMGLWADSSFVESNGARQAVGDGWVGDITPSLMFVKTFEDGEAFARIGSSVEVLNISDRPFDATIDIGGSKNIGGNFALTGTLGGSYRVGGYFEARGSVRVVGKF